MVDEWNTSKVCHRCNQGLSLVKPIRKDQLEKDNENDKEVNRNDNENEEVENTKKKRRKVDYPLRGLLHCSSQSKNDYYNNNNNHPSNEDKKENIASTGENTPPTSSPPPPPAFCPIGGMFVNRDSNAATNIALKFISSRIKNPTSDQQLSLPNLIHGVRIEKNKKIEWVKKKQFLIAKEKKMLAKKILHDVMYTQQ